MVSFRVSCWKVQLLLSLVAVQGLCRTLKGSPTWRANGLLRGELEQGAIARSLGSLFPESRDVNVTVLQRRKLIPVTGKGCLARVSRVVSTCSFFGYSLGSRWVSQHEAVTIPPRDCSRAFSVGAWAYENAVIDVASSPSGATSFFSRGNLSVHGHCSKASFQRNGVSYSNAFEETLLEFKFVEVTGVWNTEENSVKFEGVPAGVFSEGSVVDGRSGTVVWDQSAPSCRDHFFAPFEGPGLLFLGGNDGLRHRVLIFGKPDSGETLLVQLGEAGNVCGIPASGTQRDGLWAVLSQKGEGAWGRFEPGSLSRLDTLGLSLDAQLAGLLSANEGRKDAAGAQSLDSREGPATFPSE